MNANKIPRYLLLMLALGIAAGMISLSLLYLQFRWNPYEPTMAGSVDQQAFVQAAFEQQKRRGLRLIAEQLFRDGDTTNADGLLTALEGALVNKESGLEGLRFVSAGGDSVTAGRFSNAAFDDISLLVDSMLLSEPVGSSLDVVGRLDGIFGLASLRIQTAEHARSIVATAANDHRIAYTSVGLASFLTISAAMIFIWRLMRYQTKRINALRVQAEKLRDSDFGEQLPSDTEDEVGELAAVFNAMRDKLKATTLSRDYVDNILAGMNEAIIVTNIDGTITRINRAVSLLVGYEEADLLGQSIDKLVGTEGLTLLDTDASLDIPREVTLTSKFGEKIPVSYTCSIIDSGNADKPDRVYAAQNISERRRAEQRIRYLARIDPLTKVPNRMQFQHLLQREIARARRSGSALCLFYIDIDNFKEINDTFGHLAGDTTLETAANRLTAALPENATVGRLAGDEFAVIIKNLRPDPEGRAETGKLARTILDRLADPFFVQGQEVFMTASMGIAYYPTDAPNVIDLIRNADAALYSAKRSGGNVYTYYLPKMNQAAVERLITKSKLRRAFERDELFVHYQPKYNLETGEVFGAEALVRWELPERGLILPSDFIPLAEETSLIIEIGEWVLDKVCEDFRLWQRTVASPGRVSVNLSLKQLRQPNFISRISSILRSHEVSPTSLELEITETTLMENPKRTIKLLDQLYGLGLHLAIDDFGTGYSSLSALQQFPINTLKIDQAFIRDVATNTDDATIVGTIIQMGRNLNMDVVAEGVETEEQLGFLQRLHCTYAQGLLFGDPMSADNYVELLLARPQGSDAHRALFG